MDHSKLTIDALMKLKKRREKTLRRATFRLEKQQQVLEERREALLQARRELWCEWRQCSDNEQVLDAVGWRAYRAQLARYYQHDHDLLLQIETTGAEYQDINVQKEEQQQKLRQNLLEQEKLTTLLE